MFVTLMDVVDVEKDLLFKHPFTCLVAGSTSSGKSTIVAKILSDMQHLITPDLPLPIRVMWCAGSYGAIPEIKSKSISLETVTGPPPEDIDCDILVIDDQMADLADSKRMCDLFSKHSHHMKISIFFIVQNLYFQGKHMRNIALNCHYLLLTKSRRDLNQVKRLGQQVFGNGAFFFDSYKRAVIDRNYGYLLVDLSPATDEKFRLRTNIIPDEYPVTIYYPK